VFYRRAGPARGATTVRAHRGGGPIAGAGWRHGPAWHHGVRCGQPEVHTATLLRRSEDRPTVVEVVDAQEKVDAFLPFLDEAVTEGLVTMERACIIRYRHGNTPDA